MRTAIALSLLMLCLSMPTAWASKDLPHVTPQDFEKTITNTYGLRVVQVWAHWCPYCKKAEPEVADFVRRYHRQVPLYILDYNEHKEFATSLGIKKIPTFLLFHDGKYVRTLRDVPTSYSMAKWINRYAKRIYGDSFLELPPTPPEVKN